MKFAFPIVMIIIEMIFYFILLILVCNEMRFRMSMTGIHGTLFHNIRDYFLTIFWMIVMTFIMYVMVESLSLFLDHHTTLIIELCKKFIMRREHDVYIFNGDLLSY